MTSPRFNTAFPVVRSVVFVVSVGQRRRRVKTPSPLVVEDVTRRQYIRAVVSVAR